MKKFDELMKVSNEITNISVVQLPSAILAAFAVQSIIDLNHSWNDLRDLIFVMASPQGACHIVIK